MSDEQTDPSLDVLLSRDAAIVALQLCQASYALKRDDIPGFVANVMPLSGGSGAWTCELDWVQQGDDANLVFVAEFVEGGRTSAIAVALRGTDFVTSFVDKIEQAWEDLAVLGQSPVPWDGAPPDARIADGTLDAYNRIKELQFGAAQLGLDAFVSERIRRAQVPGKPRPAVLVVGHSLGGCLVSVVAPSLAQSLTAQGLSNLVVPVSFAGPTAGNDAYARYFATRCEANNRFFNSLDIVPRAWSELKDLVTLYISCSLSEIMPVDLGLAIVGILAWFEGEGISYKQPNRSVELTGTCLSFDFRSPTWTEQALHQHHTTTYMKLLGGKDLPVPRKAQLAATQVDLGGVGGEI